MKIYLVSIKWRSNMYDKLRAGKEEFRSMVLANSQQEAKELGWAEYTRDSWHPRNMFSITAKKLDQR